MFFLGQKYGFENLIIKKKYNVTSTPLFSSENGSYRNVVFLTINYLFILYGSPWRVLYMYNIDPEIPI